MQKVHPGLIGMYYITDKNTGFYLGEGGTFTEYYSAAAIFNTLDKAERAAKEKEKNHFFTAEIHKIK